MNIRTVLNTLGLMILGSCAMTGPVTTQQADSVFDVVPSPPDFTSPLGVLTEISHRIEDSSEKRIRASAFLEMGWRQSWDTLDADQAALEKELADTGEVRLEPGHSYSFDLESYCVNAGVARPVTGDELKVAALSGPAATWLPKILDSQGMQNFPQEKVQSLIWALLSGVRYDELSPEFQGILRVIFPDAPVRFGNRVLEDLGQKLVQSQTPENIQGVVDKIEDFREDAIRLQSSYVELEKRLAPPSNRHLPIPVGWMNIPAGYLLKMTSTSYTHVRVDIFVPRAAPFGREPQSGAKRFFRPSTWIGLPAQGQRLALSNRAIPRKAPNEKEECENARKWKPLSCKPLGDEERARIIATAAPERFPSTWYESPPKPGAKIEDRTDCSHFVQEVYKRSGIDFPYRATSLLSCLSVFQEVSDSEGRPGDLILYRGHVGILTQTGTVISATRGGSEQRSVLKPGMDPLKVPVRSSIQELPKTQAGSGTWKVLRWKCP